MTITTEFQITGMSCGHCENAVREEVSKLPGVEIVQVSAADGRLEITAGAPVADADVIAAVDEAGYDAERV